MNTNDPIGPAEKKASTPPLLVILMILVAFVALGYFDSEILTPAILPSDHCYYHFHHIPWWVDLFYMNGASNGHPDGSLTHLLVYIALSILTGLKAAKFLHKRFQRSKASIRKSH